MAMQLCGTNIPYEMQYKDPVAANRIHAQTIDLLRIGLCYDNLNIAFVLHSLALDGKGILRALQIGERLDAKLNQMERSDLKRELTILGNDFWKIVDCVNKHLRSTRGKERWPDQYVSIDGDVVSIPQTLDSLHSLSENFKKHAIAIR
jgi:hypothetical protein